MDVRLGKGGVRLISHVRKAARTFQKHIPSSNIMFRSTLYPILKILKEKIWVFPKIVVPPNHPFS